MLEFAGERLAEREQPLQRITDQRELFRQAGQAVHLAAGNGLPRFLRGAYALARLRDRRGIETAERRHRVVGPGMLREAIRSAHRGQAPRLPAVARPSTQRAEE